ncbi:MAG: sialidase family protein [Mycobacteriales bacterium]
MRPDRGYTNSQVLIHPKEPDTLVVAHADFLNSTCLIHVSRDAGRTWAQAKSNPVPPEFAACTRPAFGAFMDAAFGADGTLYFASTGADTATNRGPTTGYLARSSNLGSTWDFVVVAEPEKRDFTLYDGKQAKVIERFNYARLAAHPTDPDRVAVGFRVEVGETVSPAPPVRSVVAVSTDGGRTFPKPMDNIAPSLALSDLPGSDAPAMAFGPDDGALYAFTKERPRGGGVSTPSQPDFPKPTGEPALCRPASAHPDAPDLLPNPTDAPPAANEPGAGARLVMSKTTDDGETWTASVVDDGGLACIPCLTIPEVAIDAGSGAIHLAFELSQSSLPNPRDNRDIFTMTSTDGGDTWSERLKINDDDDPERQPNYDQFIAGISVAPSGRVDVAWYDMRTDAYYNPEGRGGTRRTDQTCWDVYSAFSSDGGKTFSENVRVSDRTMNQNSGFALNLSYDLRAPIGVASSDTTTFVVWPDSRSGTFSLPTEDTYLATVLHGHEASPLSGIKLPSLLLGVAAAFAFGGLILLIFSRRRRADQAG